MKSVKQSKIIVCIVVLAMATIMLAGCSSKNSLVGTWTFDYAEYRDEQLTAEQLDGISAELSDMKIEFKNDTNVVMTLGDESSDGTYKQDGATITITSEGSDQDFTYENDQLSWTTAGVTLYFKK